MPGAFESALHRVHLYQQRNACQHWENGGGALLNKNTLINQVCSKVPISGVLQHEKVHVSMPLGPINAGKLIPLVMDFLYT